MRTNKIKKCHIDSQIGDRAQTIGKLTVMDEKLCTKCRSKMKKVQNPSMMTCFLCFSLDWWSLYLVSSLSLSSLQLITIRVNSLWKLLQFPAFHSVSLSLQRNHSSKNLNGICSDVHRKDIFCNKSVIYWQNVNRDQIMFLYLFLNLSFMSNMNLISILYFS